MAKLKRHAAELNTRCLNSLILAIELFNRPFEKGRSDGVPIFLHRAFEMLLKAIIKSKARLIHAKGEKYSYGFDKCLEVAQNDLRLISADERAVLSILHAHRDIAVHYYQEISEDMLYVQAQSAVTIFDDLLKRVVGQKLAECMPKRVLPI